MNFFRTGHWKFVVAGALAFVGLLAAALAWHNSGGRTTVPSLPAPSDEPMPLGIGLVSVEDAGVDGIVAQTTEAIGRRAAEASLPQGEAMAADAGEILSAWLGGTSDAYLAYLESNGHKPPPAAVWKDPERRDSAWLRATRLVRKASFDPANTVIRTTFFNGEFVPDDQSRLAGWRFDKLTGVRDNLPSAEQLSALNIEVREIVIPMRSQSLIHGADFNGSLALSYVQDPTTRAWTLVAVSVYDVPMNDTSLVPPF